MKNIICNSVILGALLISTQSKAQHILEAIDAPLFSSTQSRTANKIFTRDNCSIGYSGGTWDVQRIASATATSAISQADADNKAETEAYNNALAMVNAEGQIDANSNALCVEDMKSCNISHFNSVGAPKFFGVSTLAECQAHYYRCEIGRTVEHNSLTCDGFWNGQRITHYFPIVRPPSL